MATIIPVAATEPYDPGHEHDNLLVAQPASTGLRRRNVGPQGERKSNDPEEEEVGCGQLCNSARFIWSYFGCTFSRPS